MRNNRLKFQLKKNPDIKAIETMDNSSYTIIYCNAIIAEIYLKIKLKITNIMIEVYRFLSQWIQWVR